MMGTTRNGDTPASECSARPNSKPANPSDRHPTTTADTTPKVSVLRGQDQTPHRRMSAQSRKQPQAGHKHGVDRPHSYRGDTGGAMSAS